MKINVSQHILLHRGLENLCFCGKYAVSNPSLLCPIAELAGAEQLPMTSVDISADLSRGVQKPLSHTQPTVGVDLYKISTRRNCRSYAVHARYAPELVNVLLVCGLCGYRSILAGFSCNNIEQHKYLSATTWQKYSDGAVVYHREVGGCMLPVWSQYYEAAHSLLYVINLNATALLAAAVTELYLLLQQPSIQVSCE